MKNKKWKKIIIISLIILGIGSLFLLSSLSKRIPKNPENTVGNTAGNINNKGLFCESNGKVFFANPYDNYTMYVMDLDESNIKKLNNSNVSFITADDNFLYFYRTSLDNQQGLGYLLNTNGLSRMKKNGTQVSGMHRNIIFSMQLIGNHIYYLSSNEKGPLFYKISTDGKKEDLIGNFSLNPACAKDGTIYYNMTSDHHYLCSYDTKTDTSKEIWKGNIWYPVLEGNYIYYLDVEQNYCLCRYHLQTEEVEVLSSDRVDCFNIGSGYIYYQKNSATEPSLKRMKYDGSEQEIICEGNFTHINMTSQYVYFHNFASSVPMYKTPVSGPINVTTFDAAQHAVTSSK